MSDKTDIVERLRKRSSKMRGFRFFFSAADMDAAEAEITRLRAENAALSAEISRVRLGDLAQRTAERDEARRSACMVKARYLESIDGFPRPTDDEIGIKARAIARGMGWNCFAPHANTTDVPVQNGGA
jgi:hypothetical protein